MWGYAPGLRSPIALHFMDFRSSELKPSETRFQKYFVQWQYEFGECVVWAVHRVQ